MINITHKDLISIGKVVTATILAQIVGGLIGYFAKPYHFTFLNIWVGAVLGTLPGFLIGTVWHFANKKRKSNLLVFLNLTFGFIVLVITLFAFFIIIPIFEGEAKRITLMKNLNNNIVTKIDVYNKEGQKLLETIKDEKILSKFALNCNDTNGYIPNHPDYTKSWYLIVYTNSETLELDCHFMQRDNSMIYGGFVHRETNSMTSFGSFKSKNLRKWFDKYIISN